MIHGIQHEFLADTPSEDAWTWSSPSHIPGKHLLCCFGPRVSHLNTWHLLTRVWKLRASAHQYWEAKCREREPWWSFRTVHLASPISWDQLSLLCVPKAARSVGYADDSSCSAKPMAVPFLKRDSKHRSRSSNSAQKHVMYCVWSLDRMSKSSVCTVLATFSILWSPVLCATDLHFPNGYGCSVCFGRVCWNLHRDDCKRLECDDSFHVSPDISDL